MSAPARGSLVSTGLSDGATLAGTTEQTFDIDLTGAWYAEIFIEITFPASNALDTLVYQASSVDTTPAYPARANCPQVATVPATVSTTQSRTFYVGQGLHRIRIYNSGSGTITIARVRVRAYT